MLAERTSTVGGSSIVSAAMWRWRQRRKMLRTRFQRGAPPRQGLWLRAPLAANGLHLKDGIHHLPGAAPMGASPAHRSKGPGRRRTSLPW